MIQTPPEPGPPASPFGSLSLRRYAPALPAALPPLHRRSWRLRPGRFRGAGPARRRPIPGRDVSRAASAAPSRSSWLLVADVDPDDQHDENRRSHPVDDQAERRPNGPPRTRSTGVSRTPVTTDTVRSFYLLRGRSHDRLARTACGSRSEPSATPALLPSRYLLAALAYSCWPAPILGTPFARQAPTQTLWEAGTARRRRLSGNRIGPNSVKGSWPVWARCDPGRWG